MWKDYDFSDTIIKTNVGRNNQINASDIQPSGKFPVIDQGQGFIAGYTDEASKVISNDLPLVIFGDHTRCFKYVDFPFVLGADGTKVLKPNPELFDPIFYYFALLSLDIQNRGYNRHFTLLKEKKVPRPEIPEQRRIAHVLTTVQTAIEQQERLMVLTQELKAALMQKLFTEGLHGEKQKQTEIGPVPESWKIVKVKDYAQVKGGKRLPKGERLLDEKTDHPYLRVTDFKDYTIDIVGLKYLLPEAQAKIKRYIITDKDVFISIAGTIGVTGMASSELNGANLTENASKIVMQNENLSPRFLMYYLSTDDAQREIHSQTVKNAQPKLALMRIESMKIPIPKTDEQQEIIKTLDTLRQKQILLQQKKTLLQELFRTLLHQLMTAQIRVNHLDFESLEEEAHAEAR